MNHSIEGPRPILLYCSESEARLFEDVALQTGEPVHTLIPKLAMLAIEYRDLATHAKKAAQIALNLQAQHQVILSALGIVENWLMHEAGDIGTREERIAMCDTALDAIRDAMKPIPLGDV